MNNTDDLIIDTNEDIVTKNEINDFVIEVDSALSVSNALTEIEVSY